MPPAKTIENNIAKVLTKLEKASNKGTNIPPNILLAKAASFSLSATSVSFCNCQSEKTCFSYVLRHISVPINTPSFDIVIVFIDVNIITMIVVMIQTIPNSESEELFKKVICKSLVGFSILLRNEATIRIFKISI